MQRNNINNLLEYLSPILILSYFLFHNIIPVLIGISFSLYLINIDFINSLGESIKMIFAREKLSKYSNKDNQTIKDYPYLINFTKENSELTLVETIEELGFIPSIDKNDGTRSE